MSNSNPKPAKVKKWFVKLLKHILHVIRLNVNHSDESSCLNETVQLYDELSSFFAAQASRLRADAYIKLLTDASSDDDNDKPMNDNS